MKENMGPDEEGYKGYSVVSLPNKMKIRRDESASGLLEDVASYLIVFTHSCMEKMTYLPFPVGTIIEAVEELVVPLAHPMEGFTLRFLASLDDQIYAAGTSVEGFVLCASRKLDSVFSLLHTRGPIGMSADFWAQHEALMKEKVQTMVDLANKIPLFGLLTPFVCTVSAPLARAISDFLVEHSESQDRKIYHKTIQSGRESLDELEEKPGDRLTRVTEIVEAKEEDTGKPLDGAVAGEAKKGAQEHRLSTVTHKDKETDANHVSVVIDMIESGWLLGSPRADSPRTSLAAVPKMSPSATAVPKTFASPKKPAANPKSRRGILRH